MRSIEEGKVDLVAVGRALLADPEWAMKAVKTLNRK
jgi:2,4-dienoyl-CoA reductase-like NADH-dependent reductase (Old Yellow Enzyme family)